MPETTSPTTPTTTTRPSRSHLVYLAPEATLASALADAFPLGLPKSATQARARYGATGRPVLIHISIEELPE